MLITNQKHLLIFFSSIFIFTIILLGGTDWLSDTVSTFLLNSLGYTNKWVTTFGPSWFVNITTNFSALGSKEIVVLFSSAFAILLYIRQEYNRLTDFSITIIGGMILLIIFKLIFVSEHSEFSDILTESISSFPSGHAFMAVVLYFAILTYFMKQTSNFYLKKFYKQLMVILILIVSLSRILSAAHTLKEVLAGWVLATSWLSLIAIFLSQKVKK